MAKGEYKDGIDEELRFLQFIKDGQARYDEALLPGFWYGKTPCWEITNCPDSIKNTCPAPKYPSLPCWQIEGIFCKLDERSASGSDTSICKLCRVYEQYGSGRSLKIKLFTSDQHH